MKALSLVFVIASSACGWLEGVEAPTCFDGVINYPGCGEVTVVAAEPHVIMAGTDSTDEDTVTAVEAEFVTLAVNAQTCYGAPVEIADFFVNVFGTVDELRAACEVKNDPNVVACTSGSAFAFSLDTRPQWPELFGHELGHAFHELNDDDGGDPDHHDNFWFGRASGEYGGLTKSGSIADCAHARGAQ